MLGVNDRDGTEGLPRSGRTVGELLEAVSVVHGGPSG
jgi:hypothetical protein